MRGKRYLCVIVALVILSSIFGACIDKNNNGTDSSTNQSQTTMYCTVDFDTGVGGNIIESITVRKNSTNNNKISTLKPKRTNGIFTYKFKGWLYSDTMKSYDKNLPIGKDTTLVADWDIDYIKLGKYPRTRFNASELELVASTRKENKYDSYRYDSSGNKIGLMANVYSYYTIEDVDGVLYEEVDTSTGKKYYRFEDIIWDYVEVDGKTTVLLNPDESTKAFVARESLDYIYYASTSDPIAENVSLWAYSRAKYFANEVFFAKAKLGKDKVIKSTIKNDKGTYPLGAITYNGTYASNTKDYVFLPSSHDISDSKSIVGINKNYSRETLINEYSEYKAGTCGVSDVKKYVFATRTPNKENPSTPATKLFTSFEKEQRTDNVKGAFGFRPMIIVRCDN